MEHFWTEKIILKEISSLLHRQLYRDNIFSAKKLTNFIRNSFFNKINSIIHFFSFYIQRLSQMIVYITFISHSLDKPVDDYI